MRRTKRRGFTFIELLVVMVVMGILAGFGVPRIRSMKERSYQATLQTDLGALRTAEEAYFTENLRYTTDLSALDFRSSSNVAIAIESADPLKGWRATAKHIWLDEPCTTAAGPDAIGIEAGAIVCAKLGISVGGAMQAK